jgi:hypothetical protein
MRKKDFKSALPYADAAAQTASAAGLFSSSDAHSGIGDWSGAESTLTDEMTHYSDTPMYWYRWCTRSGHGNVAGARKAMEDFVFNKGTRATSQDLMNAACAQMSGGDLKGALSTFTRRMSEGPGPTSGIYIALLNDELHDTAARDAAFAQVQSLPEHASRLGQMAALLAKAMRANPPGMLDPIAIEKLVNGATESEQASILAMAGRYLEDHGHKANAADYYKRCVAMNTFYVERFWIDPDLQAQGVDTWTLDPGASPHP